MIISRMCWVSGAFFGFLALLTVTPVSADTVKFDAGVSDTLGESTTAPSDKWRFTLGLGAVAVPDYEGSDDYDAAPLPIARAQKGHRYGQLFGLKLSSNLIDHPNFRLGPVANYRPKRDDVDNSQVDALADVDAAFELGLQVGYDLRLDGAILGFGLEFVHDVADGHEGWLLTPEVSYRRPFAERWLMNMALSVTYASDDYNETYFGITPSDSARSGLPVYSASDDFKDISLATSLSYDLTKNWDVGGLFVYKRLLGDAEDSPVTNVGSENQFIAGVFVTYSWQGN